MSDYLSELLVGLLTTLELTAASLLLGGLLALLLTGLLEFRWRPVCWLIEGYLLLLTVPRCWCRSSSSTMVRPSLTG